VSVNPKILPNTHQYVSALPDGLSSYPQCQIKADVFRDLVNDFPNLADNPDVPESLRFHLTDTLHYTWQPEVIANTITLLIRDLVFASDREYLDWFRRYIARVFDKPFYRIVIHVLSTTLVVMGATDRWAKFHRGSTLQITEPVKKVGKRLSTKGKLSYPPNLFSGLLLDQICATYLAALDANRAEEPDVRIEKNDEIEAFFSASWKA